jgi:hypothetical protein
MKQAKNIAYSGPGRSLWVVPRRRRKWTIEAGGRFTAQHVKRDENGQAHWIRRIVIERVNSSGRSGSSWRKAQLIFATFRVALQNTSELLEQASETEVGPSFVLLWASENWQPQCALYMRRELVRGLGAAFTLSAQKHELIFHHVNDMCQHAMTVKKYAKWLWEGMTGAGSSFFLVVCSTSRPIFFWCSRSTSIYNLCYCLLG